MKEVVYKVICDNCGKKVVVGSDESKPEGWFYVMIDGEKKILTRSDYPGIPVPDFEWQMIKTNSACCSIHCVKALVKDLFT